MMQRRLSHADGNIGPVAAPSIRTLEGGAGFPSGLLPPTRNKAQAGFPRLATCLDHNNNVDIGCWADLVAGAEGWSVGRHGERLDEGDNFIPTVRLRKAPADALCLYWIVEASAWA